MMIRAINGFAGDSLSFHGHMNDNNTRTPTKQQGEATSRCQLSNINSWKVLDNISPPHVIGYQDGNKDMDWTGKERESNQLTDCLSSFFSSDIFISSFLLKLSSLGWLPSILSRFERESEENNGKQVPFYDSWSRCRWCQASFKEGYLLCLVLVCYLYFCSQEYGTLGLKRKCVHHESQSTRDNTVLLSSLILKCLYVWFYNF